MPQLAGNPLDWFLLQCAVRWFCAAVSSFAKIWSPAESETRFSISQEVFLRVCYASDRGWLLFPSSVIVLASNHAIPGELLADYSKTSFAVTKILNACMILHVIWQASSQFQCMLVLILYLQYTTLYSSLLGNLQICWEPSMQVAGCSRPCT